jgi:hypothetical protein
MTKNEVLTQMRALEVRLFSAEVQDFFKTKSQPTRDRFASLLSEISQQVAKLTNAQIAGISNKLDELSPDLEQGIKNLQGKLDSLENTVTILNTISTVLGLVGRVLAFA